MVQRGKELRDMLEAKDHISNQLKAAEIERDTVHERLQVTVSQMNDDIA